MLRKLLASIFRIQARQTPARPANEVTVNTRWIVPKAIVVTRSTVKPDGRGRSYTNQLSS